MTRTATAARGDPPASASEANRITPEAIGPFVGAVNPRLHSTELVAQLAAIRDRLTSPDAVAVSDGPDPVVRVPLMTDQGGMDVAVKRYGRRRWIQDVFDARRGSRAERSYRAARFLADHNIGTPEPIAYLERWDGRRLVESYYISRMTDAEDFGSALASVYYDTHDNAHMMALIETVAPAIRAMHDAGFMHGDLGNQNIFLPRHADGSFAPPQFIDLNRSTMRASLSWRERAFDLSRIALPGAYLRIFKHIYCRHDDIPRPLDRFEKHYRFRFAVHEWSRRLRHPLRYLRGEQKARRHRKYPPLKDMWLWDEKTAQPMIVLSRRQKNRYRDLAYMARMVGQAGTTLPRIYPRYRRLLAASYASPVALAGRVGVALHPDPEYIEREQALHAELGAPPVLVRFCRHEGSDAWDRGIELVRDLGARGVSVSAAMLQDREAVVNPDCWRTFLEHVVPSIAAYVDDVEIAHAINRVKWGVWSDREYRRLLEPALAMQQRLPDVRIVGPACIDFEYAPVIAALRALPAGDRLAALSHHLYVDRRGAPERRQGAFSTLEKCAMLRAIAQWSPRCDDRVIISEINWPIQGTGVWSPIGCPYETPQWRRDNPGVTEAAYADYLVRMQLIALCSGHIDRLFWWRLSAHGYGLVDERDNWRRRPAYTALQFYLHTLGNATFARTLPSDDNVHLFECAADGQRIIVAWTSDDHAAGGRAPAPLPSAAAACDRAFDILGRPVDPEAITLSGSPIYLITDAG
jgi:tRNA A-37 threonylcarbamoyl transferase component Bud32